MRILHIIQNFFPCVGGAELHTYELCKHLAAKGYDVCVATSTKGASSRAVQEEVDGVLVFRFPNVQVGEYQTIHPTLYTWLTKAAKAFDVVHAHGLRSPYSLASAQVSRRRGKPLVLTLHGVFDPRNWAETLIKKPFDATATKYILKQCKAIIAVSEFEKQAFSQRFPSFSHKATLVHRGVTIYDVGDEDKREALKSFGLEGNKVVLTVSRLAPYKGLEFLLQSIPHVLKRRSDVVFAIVGEDWGYGERLRKMSRLLGVEKSIRFLGPVYGTKLAALYKASDVYVMPSAFEASATTLKEALCYGVPVVATKVGLAPELLRDGENGYLVDYGDAEALASRICDALERGKKSFSIDAAKLRQTYSWEVTVKEVAEIYHRVTSTR